MKNTGKIIVYVVGLLSLVACQSAQNSHSDTKGGQSSTGVPGPDGLAASKFWNNSATLAKVQELDINGFQAEGQPTQSIVSGNCYAVETYFVCDRDYWISQIYKNAGGQTRLLNGVVSVARGRSVEVRVITESAFAKPMAAFITEAYENRVETTATGTSLEDKALNMFAQSTDSQNAGVSLKNAGFAPWGSPKAALIQITCSENDASICIQYYLVNQAFSKDSGIVRSVTSVVRFSSLSAPYIGLLSETSFQKTMNSFKSSSQNSGLIGTHYSCDNDLEFFFIDGSIVTLSFHGINAHKLYSVSDQSITIDDRVLTLSSDCSVMTAPEQNHGTYTTRSLTCKKQP